MEDVPPSYHQSVNPSVLDLVAPYLDTISLHAMTLVSRSYNDTFMPHLWGSPASHFVPVTNSTSPGVSRTAKTQFSYDDLVYVALTRFKKILKIARESTRRLTHTLYLPAANSEIYSGPSVTWLREILDGLLNLQSLCVSGLPFFDHHSLVAVNKNRPAHPDQEHRTYPVKLLLAAKESNTTSIGLSLFLPHLSSLVYLDLSYTTPARDINVLSSLSALDDLQVLKLRGIGLRDTEAVTLASAIGLRVRLLDVADNLLGDMAVRSLLEACFVNSKDDSTISPGGNSIRSSRPDYHSRRHLESWPVGIPPAPDFLSLDTLRSADLDKNLLIQLTNPLTGRLAFEDIPHSGLTHLYITGNQAVTIEGVRSLLEIGRLHVLDAGDVGGETAVDKYVRSVRDSGKYHGRNRSFGSGSTSITGSRRSGGHIDTDTDELEAGDDEFHLPGAEKLIPVLREKASRNLTYLRLEHSVITKECEIIKERETKTKENKSLIDPKPATSELDGEPGGAGIVEVPGSMRQAVEIAGSKHHAVELPSQLDVFELDATPVTRAELPGDLIHFAISPPISDMPESSAKDDRVFGPIRGEGPFAPEVVQDSDRNDDKRDMAETKVSSLNDSTTSISATSRFPPFNLDAVQESGTKSDIQNKRPGTPLKPRSSSTAHQEQLNSLLGHRPTAMSPILHPSSLPNLRTLILTNVPSQVAGTSSPILKAIINFITACAAESFIAISRAQTDYSLPPGRARAAAERKHAQSLFALRTLILEVSPVQDLRQRDWKHTRQRLNISKSSTGDHDSEALWSAAENDFSFFGHEGEEHDECGIYDYEPGKYFPSVHLDDKFAVIPDDMSSISGSGHNHGTSGPGTLALNSPTSAVFRSPRELPLGRNRRPSDDVRSRDSLSFSSSNRPNFHSSIEMPVPGYIATSAPRVKLAPTSAPQKVPQPPPLVDLISELSKWRKERKAAYEEEVRRLNRIGGVTVRRDSTSRLADREAFVEGHWKGEIKVVRNAGPTVAGVARGRGRLERNGMVDVYGNYFEKGYLYS